MNEIEMIKAFAELEGGRSEIQRDRNGGYVITENSRDFNPIQDLALNCKARDKYGVMIVYHFKKDKFYVSCYNGLEHVEVDLNSDIPRAVIECILKSKGLYHE